MQMKNMKIEINESQPLGEVVRELERLRYKPERHQINCNSVCTYEDGSYICYMMRCELKYQDLKTTTLAELRGM